MAAVNRHFLPVGNPPPPAGPGAVAPGADDRVDHEIDRRRNAADDQPDQPVRRLVHPQIERQQIRDQQLHHAETEVAPQHPDEEVHQPEGGVTECADPITARVVRRPRSDVHIQRPPCIVNLMDTVHYNSNRLKIKVIHKKKDDFYEN